ncbi:MAG: CapA family protein [Deltaproteobacteria bacterium]|nr:CapA family protein [Deltaproteobacteria bacterium]
MWRRWALRTLTGLVVAGAGAGGWSAFWTLYDPEVRVAPPLVVVRPRRTTSARVRLALAGDFAPTDAAMKIIRRRGYRYPYEATARILRDADVSFANLEAPVTGSPEIFPLPKRWIYAVDPAATEAWRWLGLDVVSLANNHVTDHRDRGVLDTVRHLDAAGIAHVGAGAGEGAARRPVVFDVGGTRVGFLAYLEDRAQYNLYFRAFAVGDGVGCARFGLRDLTEDVRRLRREVDVLVVSVHWGDNYRPITASQREMARHLADLGVDVVAGHHPHDVQGVEVRGKTVILYSLGNYAWGAIGHDTLRVGTIARIDLVPRKGDAPARLSAVELLPIVTQNRFVRFRPRRIEAGEVRWLEPLLAESRALGTPVELDGTTIRVGLNTDQNL